MEITLARESDLAAAVALWSERLAILQQSDPHIKPLPAASESWRRQARLWIAAQDCAVFVAKSNGKLLGYLALKVADGPPGLYPTHIGVVIDMAVGLHQAHPGLSRKLLERGKTWLRSLDIEYLEINAPARYPVEEAFWRGQGAQLRSNKYWLQL